MIAPRLARHAHTLYDGNLLEHIVDSEVLSCRASLLTTVLANRSHFQEKTLVGEVAEWPKATVC